ncbi:glycoside hydrolase family 32 protein [Labilibaculum sp. DW002]|uniref:Glycoside hydrolase family 32 protein n=1 Tax=Paralabilibaculum antarcticum TaxID=2912572 RepID=A0ABT5VS72_9BACT|nr:glycoside hydrolase family 32 protein [Labilibaculum sp. DW002]MDE5418095.1 glycoside hydrolase family 32 protein [Labilibaculum sp. DW002]
MKNYLFIILIVSAMISSCNLTSERKQEESTTKVYQEKHRPQFHFTPEANWMNDPNGMVYYEGEYHLFYQYYPDSTVWGPMHWGHAVSKNLMHWEHLPIALYPDSLGYIFSGSAVIDYENTSGFGSADKPAMVAIYTYHNMEGEKAGRNDFQSQGIAYSIDKGRTWSKYEKNPVLKSPGIRDFRDPKVIWHKESKKWIMSLAVQDHISFYSSSNLIDWTFESDFGKELGSHGGVWECPDLFPIKVDGSDGVKWILIVSIGDGGPNGGSATQYFIGDFDGKEFVSTEKDIKWLDYGRDNYAGVTWSNVPEEDGRVLFIGWMSNWQYATLVPTENWRSANTFPRELILKKENNKYHLNSVPVKELELIREECYIIPNQDIKGNFDVANAIPFKAIPIEIDLEIVWDEQPQKFGIKLSNSVGEELEAFYSGVDESFTIDRTKLKDSSFSDAFASIDKADVSCKTGIKLQILIDESSIEVFVNGGEVVVTDQFFSTEKFDKLEIVSGGNISVKEAKFYKLKSVW